MSKIDDGGPAHPFVSWRSPDGMYATKNQEGMSLRDHFAGQALSGVMAGENSDEIYEADEVARRSYRLADAMIAARKAGA